MGKIIHIVHIEYLFILEGYFIVGFRLFNEPDQGFWDDDSTTINLAVMCRGYSLGGSHTQKLQANGDSQPNAAWGTWSGTCDSGQAVNAIRVCIKSQ